MAKILWTEDEIKILEECYQQMLSSDEIVEKIPRHTKQAIFTKANKLGLSQKYIRNNNPSFKAEYQDYDWCYQKIIIEGKNCKQLAEETGYSRRVLEKWTGEKYNLSNRTYAQYATLTPLQYSIILAGTLGDGHIDKREEYPIYIESHAEDEKDYLYWKYEMLNNLCLSAPVRIEGSEKMFNGKMYHVQNQYRFITRTIKALADIRSMNRCEKINQLDELGFCTHMLDDGSKYCNGNHNNWEICFGDWTMDETQCYLNMVNEKFGLHPTLCKDIRYARYTVAESKIIDEIILRNIPNHLDVIQKKIFNRKAA